MNFSTSDGFKYLRILRLIIEGCYSSCRNMVIILSRYPHSHRQDVFPVCLFPEFKSVKTTRIASSGVTYDDDDSVY